MRLISCHDGKLLTLDAELPGAVRGATGCAISAAGPGFVTGLPALDALPPGGAFARGAVHELLCDPAHGMPLFLAMLLARTCGTGARPCLKITSTGEAPVPRPTGRHDLVRSPRRDLPPRPGRPWDSFGPTVPAPPPSLGRSDLGGRRVPPLQRRGGGRRLDRVPPVACRSPPAPALGRTGRRRRAAAPPRRAARLRPSTRPSPAGSSAPCPGSGPFNAGAFN